MSQQEQENDGGKVTMKNFQRGRVLGKGAFGKVCEAASELVLICAGVRRNKKGD